MRRNKEREKTVTWVITISVIEHTETVLPKFTVERKKKID